MIHRSAHIIGCLCLLTHLLACAQDASTVVFPRTPEEQFEERAREVGRQAEGDKIAEMLDLAESKLKTNPDQALRLTRALGAGLHSNGIALDIEKSAFLREAAVTVATDPHAETEARIVAIEVLRYTTWSHHAEDLLPLLHSPEPLKVQIAAIDALERLDTGEFSAAIIARWSTMSPQSRDHAATTLVHHPDRARPLLEAIRSGQIKVKDLSPANIRHLQSSTDPEISDLAKKVLLPP